MLAVREVVGVMSVWIAATATFILGAILLCETIVAYARVQLASAGPDECHIPPGEAGIKHAFILGDEQQHLPKWTSDLVTIRVLLSDVSS